MKPYGHRRSDASGCGYGCCGVNKANVSNRKPTKRKRVNSAASKRARQNGRKEIRREAR